MLPHFVVYLKTSAMMIYYSFGKLKCIPHNLIARLGLRRINSMNFETGGFVATIITLFAKAVSDSCVIVFMGIAVKFHV